MNDNVVYLKDHKAPHGPGAMAVIRDQAGGDLRAAVLLYRIKHFFDPKNNFKKLERFGRQWIAMPREQWAFEAGLNRSEMVNYALPKLKKLPFIAIRAMNVKGKKLPLD